MKALPKAQELWNKPEEMLAMWQGSEEKMRHELLIADWVSLRDRPNIVDLGCGPGRFADVLGYETYSGYDQSTPMIMAAKYEPRPRAEFSVVDIFSFQSGKEYDLALLIDVAYHQEAPVESVLRIINLWKAKSYLFTLLVGQEHEDLYNSTVVSYSELLTLVDALGPMAFHIERYGTERFSWILAEYVR